LLISLGQLDGAGRIVNGRPALVLGVDTIAQVETESDLPLFIAHELFHRYHLQVGGFSDDPGEGQPIWRTLWAEGLATYASARLYPDHALADAWLFPRDLELRCRPLLPKLASDLLRNATPDPALYRAYFAAGERVGDIPPRAGYYVGYRVAELAAREYSLSALAHQKPQQVAPRIDVYLRHLIATEATD
jgi:uncharacterized protein YjaZ